MIWKAGLEKGKFEKGILLIIALETVEINLFKKLSYGL